MKLMTIGDKVFRVANDTVSILFAPLDEKEEKSFRLWARKNCFVNVEPSSIHHPAVQDEHFQMISELS